MVNANLRRVSDRRRGLPVALGILYLHGARAQGWAICGLNFPGHFLLRLDLGAERSIIAPFNGGQPRDAVALRALLKGKTGRASGRERVCQYVKTSVVAVSLKTKHKKGPD